MGSDFDLAFQVKGDRALLLQYCSGNLETSEFPKDLLLEICQLVLSHVSTRDYSKVTSVRKLLRLIQIEKELADESDGSEESEVEEVPEPEPEPPKAAPKRARRAPAKGKKAAPAPPESDSEESSDED